MSSEEAKPLTNLTVQRTAPTAATRFASDHGAGISRVRPGAAGD